MYPLLLQTQRTIIQKGHNIKDSLYSPLEIVYPLVSDLGVEGLQAATADRDTVIKYFGPFGSVIFFNVSISAFKLNN